jgi:hypothetical protein
MFLIVLRALIVIPKLRKLTDHSLCTYIQSLILIMSLMKKVTLKRAKQLRFLLLLLRVLRQFSELFFTAYSDSLKCGMTY